ncbi:MAG: cytochrome b/b6 domain-containing protein [Spirochaetia bacterium]|nr:cytochrome b/b6 domain-containing protein [Spirochaetia bacterium]
MKEHKDYSKTYRIWHWLNAASILGLLATVLLRKTFLSYKKNGETIKAELAKLNLDISLDAAKAIGKTIREPMWDWHYVFGFMLVALFVVRIVLHFIDRPFFTKSEIETKSAHDKIVAYSYQVLYLLVMVMIITGLLLYFKETFGLSKDIASEMKEFHELLMFFFAFFVPTHIFGVLIAENKDQKGLVSNMISGKS